MKNGERVSEWPSAVDRRDIAWETAIVVVAFLAAFLAQAGALQGFYATLIALIAMGAVYIWAHWLQR